MKNYIASYGFQELIRVLNEKLNISVDQLTSIEKDIQEILLSVVNDSCSFTYESIFQDHILVKTK